MSRFLQQGTHLMITLFACLSLGLSIATADEVPNISPDEDPGFVTCDMRGGLGNQFFEIATTLAHAWDHGAIAVFPDLHRDQWKMSDHLKSVFFRINASDSPRPFSAFYDDPNWCSTKEIPFERDQKIYGYFQIWNRFDRYREKILELFAPSETIVNALNEKYGDLLSHPNTVSIHVRTANLSKHLELIHYFVGMEYYQKAMALFPPDALFVVFSDRIQWCKKHFPKLGRPCVFIEDNDEVHDFYLMSMMKHHIIPNSTFSWWASYMNQNPGKVTIVPESWQHRDLFAYPMTQPNDFYMPDWTIVVPNYYEPYPTDITDYDPPPWDGN
jgi:hypothetical protein